jgi:excisionase family DNA binding protein
MSAGALAPSNTNASTLPLAVRPAEAGRLLGLCHSRVYQLLRSGELQSYADGRARRIPMQAIHDYMARRLAEAEGRWRRILPYPPPRQRGRKRT